jgi:fructose-1,6-bisphosphatase/inositol monophosphatase family enzyme
MQRSHEDSFGVQPPSLDLVKKTLKESSILQRAVSRFKDLYEESSVDARFFLKGDGSVTSDFEATVETEVGSLLFDASPWAHVSGEEGFSLTARAADSPYRWLIDPIDGSLSFRNGGDSFSFVITLVEDDRPVAGACYFPKLNREYIAVAGEGLLCNGRRLHLGEQLSERSLMVATSDDYTFEMVNRRKILEVARSSGAIVRTCTDMYGHSQVAHGVFGIKLDAACARWDRLAATLMIQEGGGRVVFVPVDRPTEDLEGSLIVYAPPFESIVSEFVKCVA